MGSAEMKVICVQMNEAIFGALAPIAVCLESLALLHFELLKGGGMSLVPCGEAFRFHLK
jgi:hypothetical protein